MSTNLQNTSGDWKDEILRRWAKDKKVPEISDEIRDELSKNIRGKVLYRENLASYTTIRIGGSADVLIEPEGINDLQSALKIASQHKIPVHFLGWGSNTLVKDGGVKGFVIHLDRSFRVMEKVSETETEMTIRAEAGVGINAFVTFCRENNLTGMETFIGIPGSIGGAICMNAGARGVEFKDITQEVVFLEKEGTIKKVSREKLDFEYRKLHFPREAQVILEGVFCLKKGNPEEISQKIQEYQKKRVETQPLNYPNLGSVFKNPPASKKGKPQYAAELIEDAGLKGVRVGGARISDKHSNFIINEKKATAKDVLVLIDLVKEKVKERTGVVLEPEVKVIGIES